MAKQLTENHPLHKKLRLLEEFMDEHSIVIETVMDKLVLTDTESGVTAYIKEEIEHCPTIPDATETRLVIEI